MNRQRSKAVGRAVGGGQRRLLRRIGQMVLAACLSALLGHPPAAWSQDDPVRLIEAKRLELKQKEESLKREEERLAALSRDVDTKIAEYTALLAQIEKALGTFDRTRNEQLDNIVKAYEAMPAEDAAVRIAALDNATALVIMRRMKSKKAGAVMAAMEPKRAALLTKSLTTMHAKNGK